jgi:V/A-type H+-transporting ATPase subunit D
MRLELEEEHRFVREGHELLDQKRILLAGEILRRLAVYEERLAQLEQALDEARKALAGAIVRHGLAELAAHPASSPDPHAVATTREAFLGIQLVAFDRSRDPTPPERSARNPSPEARNARARFLYVVKLAVELAGDEESLRRLVDDYRRTQRRTRALEDVIAPELTQARAAIEEHLEAQDLEEAVRVRMRA